MCSTSDSIYGWKRFGEWIGSFSMPVYDEWIRNAGQDVHGINPAPKPNLLHIEGLSQQKLK